MIYDGDLIISEGKSRKETVWKRRGVRWSELLERMNAPVRTRETVAEYAAMSRDERGEVKDVGGFVGGELIGGTRKSGSVSYRQLLALDVDYGTLDLWDDVDLLMGNACCLHTTHSHLPDRPRFRLLWPLARPVDAEEYEALGRRVAATLDIEAFDDTTYQANRLMYWPSISKDGEYQFEALDGPWLSPDAVLAEYKDWRDMQSWPTSSRTKLERRRQKEHQGDPCEKPGVVGAFCRVYDVPGAIAEFLPEIYEPCGEGRYTYSGGTTSGGLVLYDDGQFAYSHHDTDPAGGRLCNSFDLVRMHLYGALDAGQDCEVFQLPSFDAMRKLCGDRPEVLVELDARIRETARDDFSGEDDGLGRYRRDFTEQGNAVRFADEYGQVLRYQKHLGWLFWDGMRWLREAKSEAMLLGMRFADTLLEEAKRAINTASDKHEKARAEAAYKWANSTRSSSKIESLLKLTAPLVNEPDVETFDADPWLLNTPAGIVDLRTGEVGPHDPLKRCTMITAVTPGAWDGTADTLWKGFLERLTGGSEGMATYLQVAAGMGSVGAVYEEGMLIPYGPGSNGKSTFYGVQTQVLGEYAGSIRPELLMARANGQEAFGLEQVRGKRLVVAAETDEGARLSASVMKRLTSRDPINANPKNKDPLTFTPTHTLVLHTNHLPRLRSLDEGTKRRMAVVPFDKVIPPGAVITDFGSRLFKREGALILGWIIAGARAFWDAGCKLAKPVEVVEATGTYFSGEDWIANFLVERCEVGEKYTAKGSELYANYSAWATQDGERPKRGIDFAKELEKKGFEKKKGMYGATWYGLRLVEDEALL